MAKNSPKDGKENFEGEATRGGHELIFQILFGGHSVNSPPVGSFERRNPRWRASASAPVAALLAPRQFIT